MIEKHKRWAALVCGLFGLALAAPASAQVVAPMEKNITSFTDKFIVQVTIQNPYETAQVSRLALFDENWQPIENAYLSRDEAYLGSKDVITITALIPFADAKTRKVYLCHTITPRVAGKSSSYRGEVCGKYTANRFTV